MEGLSRAREANGPQIREMLPGLLTAEQLAHMIHGSRAAAAATQAQSSQVRQVVASHGEDDDEADLGVEEHGVSSYIPYDAEAIRERHPDMARHPDPLVETASLASIPLPHPDFEHCLHQQVNEKKISDAQLQAVIYACMRFQKTLPDGKRAGFFLGDGAGVGKGREIAALIKQCWDKGCRKILWVSVSQDLREDARRDLDDIGAQNISIYTGNKGVPGGGWQGVLFVTYSLLRYGLSGKKRGVEEPDIFFDRLNNVNDGPEERDKGKVPTLLDLLINFNPCSSSRLCQILTWLTHRVEGGTGNANAGNDKSSMHVSSWEGFGEDKEDVSPLVIFDECHRAKNLLPEDGHHPTATGLAVMYLQLKVPDARILYSSATGASEPRNLAYMTRLGMWGFNETQEMIELLDRSKLVALELAAMSLKATGTYLARTLSYEGAEFGLARAEMDPVFRIMYDRATMVWMLVMRVMEAVYMISSKNPNEKNPRKASARWKALFWAAHQRFFRSMLMAGKVPAVAQLAKKAVQDGMCAVIGLQSTGESSTEQQRRRNDDCGFDDLVSAPRMMLSTYIQNALTGLAPKVLESKDPPAEQDDDILQGVEYQVWETCQQWKELLPSATVVAHGPLASARGMANTEEASLIVGDNIRLDRPPTQHQLHLMELKEKERCLHSNQSKIDAMTAEKKYLEEERKRLLLAVGVESESRLALHGSDHGSTPLGRDQQGGRPGFAKSDLPIKSEPRTGGRPGTSNSFFVDLTCSSDEEEEKISGILKSSPRDVVADTGPALAPTQTNGNLADQYCIKCPRPADVGMAVCLKCGGRVHAACLGLWQVPKPYTCEACENGTFGGGAPQDICRGSQRHDSRGSAKEKGSLLVRLQQIEKQLCDLNKAILRLTRDRNTPGSNDPLVKTDMENVKTPQGIHVEQMTLPASPIQGYNHAVTIRPLRIVPDEFPGDDNDDDEEGGIGREITAYYPCPRIKRIRDWLLELVESLELPANPLDDLMQLLGGRSKVAELTGRRGLVERDETTGIVQYRQRNGDDIAYKDLNLAEKKAFMQGKKLIAIISDAASTGISLQAENRPGVLNRRRRCHITLELPWSADKAIQQFGRSHRANQLSAPVYRMVVTPCGGEVRFASAAAKRLASLGALLRGDRHAVGAGSELKEFDVDNEVGSDALRRVLRSMTLENRPLPGVAVPELPADLVDLLGPEVQLTPGDTHFYLHFRHKMAQFGLLKHCGGESSIYKTHSGYFVNKFPRPTVKTFLNRMLGLPFAEQEILFKFFSDTLDATAALRKSSGSQDSGIVAITARTCTIAETVEVHRDDGAAVNRVTLAVDYGLSWEEAMTCLEENRQRLHEIAPHRSNLRLSGFYKSTQTINKAIPLSGVVRPRIILVTEVANAQAVTGSVEDIQLRCQAPNRGEKRYIKTDVVKSRWRRVSDEDAQQIWEAWFNYTATMCDHGDRCQRSGCKHLTRISDVHVLTGAVLGHWKRIEALHQAGPWGKKIPPPVDQDRDAPPSASISTEEERKIPLTVTRVITNEGKPVVGIKAQCKEEMDHFVEHLIENPNRSEDYLGKKFGSVYFDGPAVPGLPKNGSGKGKKPKHFR